MMWLDGLNYSHKDNYMIKHDNAEYSLLPHVTLKSSTVKIKPITINIKSESLTAVPLEHSHGTRYKKKNERRIIISSLPLEILYCTRALALLTNV